MRRRKDRRADSEKGNRRQMPLLSEIWIDIRFFARIAFIAASPVALGAIVARDLVLFGGTTQEAVDLLTTLIQVEATVGALVATLLFLLVELTTSGMCQ